MIYKTLTHYKHKTYIFYIDITSGAGDIKYWVRRLDRNKYTRNVHDFPCNTLKAARERMKRLLK